MSATTFRYVSTEEAAGTNLSPRGLYRIADGKEVLVALIMRSAEDLGPVIADLLNIREDAKRNVISKPKGGEA